MQAAFRLICLSASSKRHPLAPTAMSAPRQTRRLPLEGWTSYCGKQCGCWHVAHVWMHVSSHVWHVRHVAWPHLVWHVWQVA
jgi:hypothetical protein